MNKINLKELICKCAECNETVTINEASEIVQSSFSVLYNEGTILKDVELQIGPEKFNTLISSLYSTILFNLYENRKEKK